MTTLLEKIKQLQTKVNDLNTLLEKTSKELKEEKSKSINLFSKETELTNIKAKLWDCQNKKEKIQKQLGKKITEIENSNLNAEDKSKQIIELVGDGFNRLSSCSQSLNKLWTDYAGSRDKMVELYKERDEHSYEAVWAINDTKKNQWTIIWVLLSIIVLLSLALLLSITKKRKNK